jgi:regulator of replication initiation timing
MTQLANLDELTPEQLSLFQQQILVKQNLHFQQDLAELRTALTGLGRENAMMKQENENLRNQMETINHRVDNFDQLDTIGDPQQRLNKMVRKFAAQEGITFRKAWAEFKGYFNTAYRANITSLHENYQLRKGAKLSLPQYLTETGQIEDAIRVADKMLNRQRAI